MVGLIPRVKWTSQLKTEDGVFLRGIIDLLKHTFYPNYSYKKAFLGPNTKFSGKPKSSTGLHGKNLGKRVDTELEKFVLDKTILGKCSNETIYLLKYLHKKGLKIINCQFPVADKQVRLCTSVDVIAIDSGGVIVLIEVKTGYRKYKFNYTQNMKYPLTFLKDSPFSQHQLQLFITTRLFKTSFPEKKCKSLLLYVYEDEVVEHGLLESFDGSIENEVYRVIYSSKDDSRKTRKRRNSTKYKIYQKKQRNK